MCVNCCRRCVPETHTLILSSSGFVQLTDWEVKGQQVRPKYVDSNVLSDMIFFFFCLFHEAKKRTRCFIFECYFSLHPPRLRSGRHIAQVFLPLFMLLYFSMSWNAMFLVLLTLYSVIHFIINSLPNVAAVCLSSHSAVSYRVIESFTFYRKRKRREEDYRT